MEVNFCTITFTLLFGKSLQRKEGLERQGSPIASTRQGGLAKMTQMNFSVRNSCKSLWFERHHQLERGGDEGQNLSEMSQNVGLKPMRENSSGKEITSQQI